MAEQAHYYDMGWQGNLYIGDPGGAANVKVPNVLGLSLPMEHGESPLTPRDAGGFEMTEVGLTRASIEGSLPYEPGEAVYDRLAAAFAAKTPISVEVLDSTEKYGFLGDYLVTQWQRDEPQGEPTTVRFRMRPNFRYGRYPQPTTYE